MPLEEVKLSRKREAIPGAGLDPSSTHSLRDTVLIGTFGALWGLMEITLGVTLKGLRIPMGGAILTAVSVVIFLTGRYFVRRRGSILMMGAVAAILKIFSIGTVIAGPFMAILIEAIMGEVLITLLGVNRVSYLLTGTLLLLYTILHPFISQGIIFGTNIYKIYLQTFSRLAEIIQVDGSHLLWIVAGYAGIHALLGALAGWLAFQLPRRVENELQHTSFNEGSGK